MKYQPIGISPEQAQFLETRKFQINEIARIFRVPPHMLADLEKSSACGSDSKLCATCCSENSQIFNYGAVRKTNPWSRL
jgi:hypothetical protein